MDETNNNSGTDTDRENIHKLPIEMLIEIINYLTHTEKLVSRLVCSDWNRGISSILAKSSYFTLTNVDNHKVLVDSQVPWTKMKMSDSPRFLLPLKTKDSITTMVLKVSHWHRDWDLRESIRILSEFPQLIDLDVNIVRASCGQSKKSDITSEQYKILRKKFNECSKNFKKLTIEFPYGEFDDLLKILQDYFAQTISLVKLTVRESRNCMPRKQARYTIPVPHSMTNVCKIISNSSHTLKYLQVDFLSRTKNKMVTDLISRINKLEHLELESFLVHVGQEDGMSEEDFKVHWNFLKDQMAKGHMKSLSLPWCSNASLCQKCLPCLAGNIKFVGNVYPEHVSNEFPPIFSKCETIGIHSRHASMFTSLFPSIRRFQHCVLDPDQQELTLEERAQFYKNLGNSLVNVVEFYVLRYWTRQCDSYVIDLDLQHIIQNFQLLRVLEIHSGRRITDSTVSGIEETYMNKFLKQNRELRIEQNVPEEKRNGVPLSSLKHLEKLVLRGTSVTVVGIYYGLQFGSTMKQIIVETKPDIQISAFGLQWLGLGNPNLESLEWIDSSYRTGSISLDEIKTLRQRFPMLEATGKFKLVNKYN